MGFGLLLCGYFALTLMSVGMGEYQFAAYIIGGVVSLWALALLKDYCPRFILSAVTSILFVVIGLYYAGVCFNEWFLWQQPLLDRAGGLYAAVDLISVLLEFCHTAFMLWGVWELSRSLEIDRIYAPALRDIILAGLALTFEAALASSPALREYQNQMFMKLVLLYELVVYIMIAWLIFRCYRLICPKGEEDGGPIKRSRFDIINRMQDKLNEKSERAIRETMAYDAQRNEQKKKKHKKKK